MAGESGNKDVVGMVLPFFMLQWVEQRSKKNKKS